MVYKLLSNAVKFSPQGSTVVVRATRLEPEDPPLQALGVRIDVEDHGIGISVEDQDAVFEEFHQVDEGAARRYEGAGLGLTLAKRLLEIQGGQIQLESVLGSGSTFSVFFPAAAECSQDR